MIRKECNERAVQTSNMIHNYTVEENHCLYETYPINELALHPIFVQSERDYFSEDLRLSHITRIDKTLH